MLRKQDLAMTALAPIVWGSTYLVTTELLPPNLPITVATLRALPAGILLLLFVKQLPAVQWWSKIALLGALNFSIFWALLFIAAYRVPGGVAATVGALQPLFVVVFARFALGSPIQALSALAAFAGIIGVALLVLTPAASFDFIGVAAGVGGAVSMAAGTVLTRKWRPPVSSLTFTAWQLTGGGVLLLPFAVLLEPPLPGLSSENILGFVYLSVIGAALTYSWWFKGVSRIEPSIASMLGFFSPMTAVFLGWLFLGQTLSGVQIIGVSIVLGSVWLSLRAGTNVRLDHSLTSGNVKEI